MTTPLKSVHFDFEKYQDLPPSSWRIEGAHPLPDHSYANQSQEPSVVIHVSLEFENGDNYQVTNEYRLGLPKTEFFKDFQSVAQKLIDVHVKEDGEIYWNSTDAKACTSSKTKPGYLCDYIEMNRKSLLVFLNRNQLTQDLESPDEQEVVETANFLQYFKRKEFIAENFSCSTGELEVTDHGAKCHQVQAKDTRGSAEDLSGAENVSDFIETVVIREAARNLFPSLFEAVIPDELKVPLPGVI